jgi:hypothetical protein
MYHPYIDMSRGTHLLMISSYTQIIIRFIGHIPQKQAVNHLNHYVLNRPAGQPEQWPIFFLHTRRGTGGEDRLSL